MHEPTPESEFLDRTLFKFKLFLSPGSGDTFHHFLKASFFRSFVSCQARLIIFTGIFKFWELATCYKSIRVLSKYQGHHQGSQTKDILPLRGQSLERKSRCICMRFGHIFLQGHSSSFAGAWAYALVQGTVCGFCLFNSCSRVAGPLGIWISIELGSVAHWLRQFMCSLTKPCVRSPQHRRFRCTTLKYSTFCIIIVMLPSSQWYYHVEKI